MDIAEAPQWLIDLCGKPRDKSTLATQIELDTDAAAKAAISYLADAPYAIEGEGGNHTTYTVAARVKDFGVSEALALDLLLEFYNETRAIPPWTADDLERIVSNAYRYGTAPVGKMTAEAEGFEPYVPDIAKPISTDDWPSPALMRWQDPVDIPKRQWIADGVLAKTYLTGLVAPSGAGKTQYLAQLLLSVTTGRSDIAHTTIRESCPVWCWNQEDDLDELDRRMASSRIHFGIEQSDLRHPIYLNSGVDKALLLVRREADGRLKRTPEVSRIIEHIIHKRIGVLVIDPLVEFHEADENNNVEMRIVAATLRHIAAKANCAVMLGHHTRKPANARSDGFVGDADSARGASSLQGVTRIMLTLYSMSPADAKAHGVSPDDRHRYIRLDGAKSNLSLAASGARPMWLERVEAQLGFEGEKVGALAPVDLAKTRVMQERRPEPEGIAEDQMGDANGLAHAIVKAMGDASTASGTDVQKTLAEQFSVADRTLKRWMDVMAGKSFRLTDGRELIVKAAPNARRGQSLEFYILD